VSQQWGWLLKLVLLGPPWRVTEPGKALEIHHLSITSQLQKSLIFHPAFQKLVAVLVARLCWRLPEGIYGIQWGEDPRPATPWSASSPGTGSQKPAEPGFAHSEPWATEGSKQQETEGPEGPEGGEMSEMTPKIWLEIENRWMFLLKIDKFHPFITIWWWMFFSDTSCVLDRLMLGNYKSKSLVSFCSQQNRWYSRMFIPPNMESTHHSPIKPPVALLLMLKSRKIPKIHGENHGKHRFWQIPMSTFWGERHQSQGTPRPAGRVTFPDPRQRARALEPVVSMPGWGISKPLHIYIYIHIYICYINVIYIHRKKEGKKERKIDRLIDR
jgi:hypothetical protein